MRNTTRPIFIGKNGKGWRLYKINIMKDKIITVTFSPCIDRHVSIPELTPEIKLRCSDPLIQPGGGGINVARVIKRLGGKPTALYLAGGENGKALTRMLEQEGVGTVALPVEGNTRENTMVIDRSTRSQYRFIMPGPSIAESAIKEILHFLQAQDGIEFLVVSGSLPTKYSKEIFDELARIARKKGVKLVVDTSRAALTHALDAGVWMIKPSIRELAFLTGGKEKVDIKDIEAQAKELIAKQNCRVVVVSLGKAGALLVTDKLVREISSPGVKVISTVGAGDSLLAGILWKLSRGWPLDRAVEYGCACGAAAVMNAGTTLCHPEQIEALYLRLHEGAIQEAEQ